MTNPGIAEIVKRYNNYYSEISELWEDFLFVEYYYPQLHRLIKKESIPLMQFESVRTTYKAPFKKDFIYGVIDRGIKKGNPIRTLLQAVLITEDFLQKITYRIYRDFPYKLSSNEETSEQQLKLLKIITESSDKDEMISIIAEEKIRGIFYGKPSDFFTKDKARIGIDKNLKTYYKSAIQHYEEIIARRNVLAHNNGRVDRKYLRETTNSPYKLGDTIVLEKGYLKKSIQILFGLTTVATKQALESSYSSIHMNKKIEEDISRFEKKWKNK